MVAQVKEPQQPQLIGQDRKLAISDNTRLTFEKASVGLDGDVTFDALTGQMDLRQRIAKAAAYRTNQAPDLTKPLQFNTAEIAVNAHSSDNWLERQAGAVGVQQAAFEIVPDSFANRASGQASIQGDQFTVNLVSNPDSTRIDYASPLISEFITQITGELTQLEQVSAIYNGERLLVVPTVRTQVTPTFSLTAMTPIEDLFKAIEGKAPLYDHLYSSSVGIAGAGPELGNKTIRLDSYEIPGAGILSKLELPAVNGVENTAILLGNLNSIGILGVRWTFAGQNQGGGWNPISINSNGIESGTLYARASGDLLVTSAGQGKYDIIGGLTSNLSKGEKDLNLALQFKTSFGEFSTAEERPSSSASFLIEIKR
jgi:hypothetical protein